LAGVEQSDAAKNKPLPALLCVKSIVSKNILTASRKEKDMAKKAKRLTALVALTALLLALVIVGQGLAQPALTPEEELGQFLYFDTNLSEPDGQACASCHEPAFGFVDPDSHLPVSEGVIPGLFGGRNSPASAYAMYAPIRYFDEVEGLWIGGQFWDSRATGEELGDPLADQALGPFLNPVEMANESKDTVVWDALNGEYGDLFEALCGDMSDVEAAYNCIAESIGAFERTALFGQFSSKYDYYLQACLVAGGDPADCARGVGKVSSKVGKKVFTKEEWEGFQLFMNENNNNDGILQKGEGAMCVLCHVADWVDPATLANPVVVPAWAGGMIPPVFTDFTYDNLGVPKSDHPLLADAPVDLGLGPVVEDANENGKFKVMTLRNIGLTAPYAHNGLFERLIDITHFYNTRDALAACEAVQMPKPGKNCWPAPEVPATINVDELGNIGLSDTQEDLLVEFMKTLSDGWAP
jgi:cytochrome c peroxidase